MTPKKCNLNDKIIGKKQLIFLIESTHSERFGYYLNSEIIKKFGERAPVDNKSFHFNLHAPSRLQQPMKYDIKNVKRGGYWLYGNDSGYLLKIGDIELCKFKQSQTTQTLQTCESTLANKLTF